MGNSNNIKLLSPLHTGTGTPPVALATPYRASHIAKPEDSPTTTIPQYIPATLPRLYMRQLCNFFT